jgi:hypothetical protein
LEMGSVALSARFWNISAFCRITVVFSDMAFCLAHSPA